MKLKDALKKCKSKRIDIDDMNYPLKDVFFTTFELEKFVHQIDDIDMYTGEPFQWGECIVENSRVKILMEGN